MTVAKLGGFAAGEPVQLDATSAGETFTRSISEHGINATIDVTMHRSILGVAPERVTFEVTGWTGFNTPAPTVSDRYDARLHRHIYFIEWGDPDTTYSEPVNVLNEWRDRNVGFGPLASHVYRRFGTYTATIWAYEMGAVMRKAKKVFTFTVANPLDVFTGADVAYISTAGDYSNAPAGSYQHNNLKEAIDARASREKTLFMLKCGETHTDVYRAYFEGNAGHCHIVNDYDRANDADKAYVRPILIPDDGGGTNGAWLGSRAGMTNDVVIQGVELQGPWDSTSETGRANQDGISISAAGHSPRHFLIDDVKIDGFQHCVSHAGSAASNALDAGITIHDSLLTNWRKYAFYCGGATWVDLLGATIAQHVDARTGGPDSGLNNYAGPVRLPSGKRYRVTVDGCDLFSRTGWLSNVANYSTEQACLRFNTSASNGSLLVFGRTTAEGGYDIVTTTPANNTGYTEPYQNVIMDKFILIASHMTRRGITLASGGATIRNGQMKVPNVPRLDGAFDSLAFVEGLTPTMNAAACAEPVEIYNNSVSDLMTDANYEGALRFQMLLLATEFTDVSDDDNILDQPNSASPVTTHQPLSDKTVFVARNKGPTMFNSSVKQTAYATDDPFELIAPLAGSSALGSATVNPFFDIYGHKRGDVTHKGALPCAAE